MNKTEGHPQSKKHPWNTKVKVNFGKKIPFFNEEFIGNAERPQADDRTGFEQIFDDVFGD